MDVVSADLEDSEMGLARLKSQKQHLEALVVASTNEKRKLDSDLAAAQKKLFELKEENRRLRESASSSLRSPLKNFSPTHQTRSPVPPHRESLMPHAVLSDDFSENVAGEQDLFDDQSSVSIFTYIHSPSRMNVADRVELSSSGRQPHPQVDELSDVQEDNEQASECDIFDDQSSISVTTTLGKHAHGRH
jgi:hypothetical protein